jgi:hypothetical protein
MTTVLRLLISEQRRPLAILADNLAPGEDILPTQQTRQSNQDREDEQDAANGECEDPLELENG